MVGLSDPTGPTLRILPFHPWAAASPIRGTGRASPGAAWSSGEGREEEPAHLPINDAFALQEEEPDGYFCCVESARGG